MSMQPFKIRLVFLFIVLTLSHSEWYLHQKTNFTHRFL